MAIPRRTTPRTSVPQRAAATSARTEFPNSRSIALTLANVLFALALLVLFLARSANAQPPPFLFSNGSSQANPSPNARAARFVDTDQALIRGRAPRFRIELPDGPIVEAANDGFDQRGDDDVTWRGHVPGQSYSRVVLTLKNGFMAGAVQVGADVYELRPGPGRRQVFEKLDPASFPECADLDPADTPGGDAAADFAGRGSLVEASLPEASADPANQIAVMSVYTAQARAGAGGTAQIQATIQAAVDRANTAFLDSNMIARFVLVHTAEVSYNDSGNASGDLNWVRTDATVASLRNQYAADLVSLIVNDGAGYCGIGYVMRSPGSGFASSAFQVTARNCAVGNLSYAHEHGHNMGFEHNPENGPSSSSASYPWSFGHYVNGQYRTVMSYSNPCTLGCTRVTQFANPDINYQGVPTGINNQRDNSRTGDLTASIVANFRTSSTDTTAPTPNPMTFSSTPAALSSSSIAMTASSASDPSGVQYYFDCVSAGCHDSGWQAGTTYTDTLLSPDTSYTYRVKARDTSSNQNETAYSANAAATTDPAADSTPPNPSPMTWAAVPAATGETTIAMTASTASDPSGVQYYFDCVSAGCHDSGWQASSSYTDTGLTANTNYTYGVKARDNSSNLNETAYSGSAAATTNATVDSTPPNPNPMTWSSLPTATGQTTIAMAASTASDPSGVQYYFDCLSAGCHDSGWQASSSYVDPGLQPDTNYTYQVLARDQSPAQNVTSASAPAAATTDAAACVVSEMFVSGISLSSVNQSKGNKSAEATVSVLNNCGGVVSGATVSGNFTGDISESQSGGTNGGGQATLTTVNTAKPLRDFTFCVSSISNGLTYNAGANAATCASY